MSENPRDTQFANFAKLLWDEIEQCHDFYGYIPHTEHKRGLFLEGMQQIIAKRAYDLVEHTLDHAPITEYEARAENIPDLTEWPKEQEA